MKRGIKILLLLLTLTAILCTPSCKRDQQPQRSEQAAKSTAEGKAKGEKKHKGKSLAEKFAKKFAIETVEGLEGSFSSGWRLKLRVRNDSAYSPRIIAAKADLYNGKSRLASATLSEPIEIPKRSVTSLTVPINLTLGNPLLALSLISRFKSGNFEGLQASLSLTVEVMGTTRTIEVGRTDINAILTKLGYNI